MKSLLKLSNLLIMLPVIALGQAKSIDSLKKVLQAQIEDTAAISTIRELCIKLMEAGKFGEAKNYAEMELRLSENLGYNKGIGNAYMQIGNADSWLGNYADASKNYFNALKIREELQDIRGIAGAYMNIGNVNLDIRNYQGALDNYLRSMKMQKQINNKSGIADCYENIAIVLSSQNKYIEAINNYTLALNLYKELENKEAVSYVYWGMAEIYAKQNDYDNAMKSYHQSLNKMKEINNTKGLAGCYSDIGKLYAKQKKFSDAKRILNESVLLSKNNGDKNAIKISYEALSKVDSAISNYKSAYENYKLFSYYKDSLFNESSTKKIVQSEMNYEFGKKEDALRAEQDKKNTIAAQVKKRQRIIISSISTGLILVSLFTGFVFRQYKQKQKLNISLAEKNKIITEKNKEIADNINYAKRIQDAVMTPMSYVNEVLPNSFLLNKARDTVSGDFIFLEKYKDEIIIAVADSTNHSVSGAMMSILNSSLLSEAVALDIHSPEEILNYVNITIAKKFHQSDNNIKKESDIVKDGMDIALIKIDLINMKYQFAGAYNPLLIVRENQLIEVKADKLQLGQTKEKYKNSYGELQKGDTLYLSSDGYADQFSFTGKKFMKKRFKELLLSISCKPTNEQMIVLEETILNWRNGYEQTDDILVMGIKI